MPQAQVVGFHVHWEIFMCCVKQKFVLCADGATAAAVVKAPSLLADGHYTSKKEKWLQKGFPRDGREVVLLIILFPQ